MLKRKRALYCFKQEKLASIRFKGAIETYWHATVNFQEHFNWNNLPPKAEQKQWTDNYDLYVLYFVAYSTATLHSTEPMSGPISLVTIPTRSKFTCLVACSLCVYIFKTINTAETYLLTFERNITRLHPPYTFCIFFKLTCINKWV